MRNPFGCLRGLVLAVSALYILVALGSILLRDGDVSGVQVALLIAAALTVAGIALFGSSGHWTG